MGNSQSPTIEQSNQSKQPEVVINEKNGATGVVIDKKNIPNFKIVLIGDPEVGKTSIFLRYRRNMFIEDYRQTRKVVIENIVKTVNLPVKAVSSVTLWDIPGSEDMDLRASYYRLVCVSGVHNGGKWQGEQKMGCQNFYMHYISCNNKKYSSNMYSLFD
jgi:GTPase SAR1 family protein